jgi:hypothetical protein
MANLLQAENFDKFWIDHPKKMSLVLEKSFSEVCTDYDDDIRSYDDKSILYYIK